MAFIGLEDLEGSMEVIIFPKVYEKNKEAMNKDEIIVVEGSLDNAEGKAKLIAKKLSLLKEYKPGRKKSIKHKKIEEEKEKKQLHIEINCEKNQSKILIQLKKIFVKYPGKSQIILHNKRNKKSITH